MLDALIGGPFIYGQGQSGSYVDKAARAIPGMTPDKDTDIGRAAGQFLLQFLQGTPQAERNYTVNDAGEYQAGTPSRPLMNLPRSVNTNLAAYDESVTLPAVGSAGNAGAAQSLDPNSPGGGYIPPTSVQQNLPVTQLSPQDRAYAKERARVEAMVKSNPDMKKQDIAAARAKVRDQGLTEWAKANPELAKNVRPGQVGYEIARDVAYPMPTSPADSSTPQLYNPQLQYDPGFGRTISNTDVKPSVVDTSTQLPPSAEETYLNPDFYQLQAYQQGQGAAQSQTEGPKIAKLGSAIRRELYPQFDGTTSFSPQMREMFPDRSTQSLENVVQEKGIQLPGSMITADAENELLSGATDNRMYQYNQQAAEVDKLLKLIADRQLLK